MPPENLIDAEKHRAGTPVTRQQIDRWARWLELDALADAERAARRDEWLGLAVGILLEEAPPEVTDVMMEEARTEVTRRLASPETDPYLAEHCGLWNAFDQEVRAGDLAIQAREAELSERLGGKLVFIGYLATGITDLVPTPIDPSTPGVVAHAVVANTVLDKRPVRFLPALVTPIIVLVMGLLGTITALKLSPLPSVAVAVVQVAGYLGAGMLLFASQTLLVPFVAPVLAAAFCWTMAMTTQAASTRRERQRITRQFKARASGQLVEHLVMNPDQLSVSGEEREVAVLFADLANFTSISEALGGELSVATLNRYMTVMVDVLVKDGAYVNKFLGDGLMAFWSAFQIDPQQALKASRSSLACQAAVAKLNAEAKAKGHPEIGLRIGVATGRAVVGDCGAPPAINDYTVIGDVVNLAARLESANKQFKTGTLINERTRELIDADDSLAVRPLGKVVVVGQSTPTMLYELLPPDAPKELIELTQKAVEAYAEAKLDEATTILDELEQRFGPGGVVSVYRDAIANVGDVFDGVLHLRSK
jgi:adenylate cyclase